MPHSLKAAILAGTAAGVLAAMPAGPAWAGPAQHCMTRVVADVPAEEAPEQVKSKGGTFGPVTRIKVNRDTGKMVFCAGTSYCYSSTAFEFSTPCRIKRDLDVHDGTWFAFFTR